MKTSHLFSVCSPSSVLKMMNEATVTLNHMSPSVCVCVSVLSVWSVFSVEVKSLFISNKETK